MQPLKLLQYLVDGYQDRCSTYEQAVEMHRKGCEVASQPPEMTGRQ